jgi:hypothetical protein
LGTKFCVILYLQKSAEAFFYLFQGKRTKPSVVVAGKANSNILD